MKQLIFALAAFFIAFFFAISILAIGDKTARIKKLDDAVTEVMEETLENVMEHQEMSSVDKKDLLTEFEKNLYDRLGEKAKLDVTIQAFDAQKGLLSVEVIESYIHPNGKEGKIKTEKSILLEQQSIRRLVPVEYYLPQITPDITSTYMTGKSRSYRSYELQVGQPLVVPEDPPDLILCGDTKNDKTYRFTGWKVQKKNGDETSLELLSDEKMGSPGLSYNGEKDGKVVLVACYEKR